MNRAEIEEFYALSLAVRRLFHKLANAAAALHAESGISTGMRAVLESVIDGGPQTVPQMARVRPVTRQHIQGLVNALLKGGYVATVENPHHQRSMLVRATKKGERAFVALRRKETDVFRRMGLGVSAQQLQAARATLNSLVASLESDAWQQAIKSAPDAKEN